MDKLTRGNIEGFIDSAIKDREITGRVKDLINEIPVSSVKDLAFGYMMGMLNAIAETTLFISPTTRKEEEEKDLRTIKELLRRRIPEIVETINKELGK